jgi:hypothetical protein
MSACLRIALPPYRSRANARDQTRLSAALQVVLRRREVHTEGRVNEGVP